MRPRTICHPEALADWRANDEDFPVYNWEALHTIIRGINNVNDKHTLPEKQSKLKGLLAQRLEEAIERENRKRGTIRKEGEA